MYDYRASYQEKLGTEFVLHLAYNLATDLNNHSGRLFYTQRSGS